MNFEIKQAIRRLAAENHALASVLAATTPKTYRRSIPRLLQRCKELHLMVLNADETEETLTDAFEEFKKAVAQTSHDWFFEHYGEDSLRYLTPARRLRNVRYLLEVTAPRVPTPLWLFISNNDGLLPSELEVV